MNKDKYYPPISFRFPPWLWQDFKEHCHSLGIKPKLQLERLVREFLQEQERPKPRHYQSQRTGDRFIRFRQ
jgi:hypothetical protein